MAGGEGTGGERHWRLDWATAGLLAATFAIRAVRADQPIVENAVGRQVPTAMVARNLDRGSGWLRPRLDTGAGRDLFLIEPPIYAAAVVAWKRTAGMALEPSGRWVSALGTTLGVWGLLGLVRRREGSGTALLAGAAFALFPITIRYGRAFQPDLAMLGALLAGLRCWDEREAGGPIGWRVAAWSLLAVGLALKITSASVLVPVAAIARGPRRIRSIALAASTLLPALLWYAHAAALLGRGTASGAMAENAASWTRTLGLEAFGRPETYAFAARYLIVRAFTPIGFALAVAGWAGSRPIDRLWWTWAGSAMLGLLALAGKWDHEYYWLAAAPLAAIGLARALHRLFAVGPIGRVAAVGLGLGAVGLSAVQSASTWRTPAEWSGLIEAAAEVRARVPAGRLVIAPEALLYDSDRRGYRLETEPAAVARIAREQGIDLGDRSPDAFALVEALAKRTALVFADFRPPDTEPDPRRDALQAAIRRRWRVVVDRPGVLLLAEPGPSEELR